MKVVWIFDPANPEDDALLKQYQQSAGKAEVLSALKAELRTKWKYPGDKTPSLITGTYAEIADLLNQLMIDEHVEED